MSDIVDHPSYEPILASSGLPIVHLRTIFWGFGVAMAVALGTVFFMTTLLIGGQGRLTDTLLTNRQDGLKTRALACEVQYVKGIRYLPNSNCLTEDVRAYWNPNHLTLRASP